MSKFQIHNAIMCEFLTENSNNKHTLVNTISGDLLVPSFPAKLSMAFYIELVPNENYEGKFEFQLVMGDKKAGLAKSEMNLEKGEMVVLALPALHVRVPEPTEVKLVLQSDDESSSVLMTKLIYSTSGSILDE